MAKSKRWSIKDIRTIQRVIKHGLATGKTETECLQSAADYFGVTLNAVTLRWSRWKAGKSLKTLEKDTTKVPMKRKKAIRKPYKKRFNPNNIVAEPSEKSITIKIKNAKIDLKKGTITIFY